MVFLIVVVVIVVWIICGVLSAAIAKSKNRNPSIPNQTNQTLYCLSPSAYIRPNLALLDFTAKFGTAKYLTIY